MSKYLGCMLASDYEPKRIKYPVAVEDKLDGLRFTHVGGQGYTRNGNTYDSVRAFSEVLHQVATGLHVDTEMMSVKNWNETSKLLKRLKNVDHDRIKQEVVCYVFDAFDEETIQHKIPYAQRRDWLYEIVQDVNETGKGLRFEATHCVLAHNEAELMQAYNDALTRGREGVMIKPLDGVYVTKRSFHWLKLKPEKDFTVTVEGYEPMNGKCPACSLVTSKGLKEGCTTCNGTEEVEYQDRLGALLCRMDDGREVKVGGGFTQAQRFEFWTQRKDLIGKKIDVKGQDESHTSNDIAIRFPRFLRVREDL